jgi:hypothetical protein
MRLLFDHSAVEQKQEPSDEDCKNDFSFQNQVQTDERPNRDMEIPKNQNCNQVKKSPITLIGNMECHE